MSDDAQVIDITRYIWPHCPDCGRAMGVLYLPGGETEKYCAACSVAAKKARAGQ